MGKVLKILISVILLVLSITAAILASKVYGSREQVIARNQILTAGLLKIAPTIEDKVVEEQEQKNPPPAKDISPATAEFIEKAPELSDFWTKKYSAALEQNKAAPFDISNRKGELMTLYKKNPLGDFDVDPTTGQKRMDGEGTMQNLIEEIFKKSGAQLTRLNDTRQMLTIVKDELIDTINELNKNKVELRKKTKEVDAIKAEADKVAAEFAAVKPKVEAAEAAKKAAEEKAIDMEKQKTEAEEKNRELEIDKKKLEKELKERLKPVVAPVEDAPKGEVVFNFTPNVKGKVVAVNNEWNYVLIALDEAFLKESMGEDLSKPAPTGVTMSIKRPGNNETFVTKVRLTLISGKDKHAIGDILLDWKQQPVHEGDIVFFP